MEAVALHAFTATAEDELSFKKGTILKVLSTDDDKNWYRAEQEGHQGMVPYNYIKMKPHEWYVGKITRTKAEELLLKPEQPDGAFMVRNSESTPGDFSISVKFQNGVQHFKVLRDPAGKYFLWVLKFNSINELIDYHRTATVSRSHDIFLKDMVATKEESYCSLARAVYDFEAQSDDELSFRKGDVIKVLEEPNGSWCRGQVDHRQGMFPINYVEILNDRNVRPSN